MKTFSIKFETSRLLFAAMICTTFIGTTTVAHSAEKIAWKFKAKQTLNYKINVEMKIARKAAGGGAMGVMLTTQELDVLWTIEKVNQDGSCQMSQVVKRMVMNLDAGFMKVKFDSANPNAGGNGRLAAAMAEPYRALIGEKIMVTMAAHGEITKIEFPKKFLKTIKTDAAAPANKGISSKGTMISLIRQSVPVLSKKPVSVNDKWENKTVINNSMMPWTIKNAYRYAGTEKQGKNSDAKIQVTSKVTLDKNVGGRGPTKTLKKQSGTGTILFDVAKGVMKSYLLKQQMSVELSMGKQKSQMSVENSIDVQLIPPKK